MARDLFDLHSRLENYAKWTREVQDRVYGERNHSYISIEDMDAEMLEEAAEIVWMYRSLQ